MSSFKGAVIYCRCSTEEESQKDALKTQVKEARQCAEEMKWCLVREYVESRSGTSTAGRPEYLKLYADLETEKFDIIIIKSVDRLMRNVKDWYLFVDRMVQNNKKLYLYIEKKFYTPEDSLITGIKAIMAEDYSRELSKKINNAHYHRQREGKVAVITNQTFGYRKLPDKSVVIDEQEVSIIKRIFQLGLQGYGVKIISNILYKEGIRNRRGSRLSDTSVLRIIRNPMYKGTVVMNKNHYDFERKVVIKVPKEDWIIHKNMIPAIISEEIWNEVNRQVDERRCVTNKDSHGSYQKGLNPGKYLLSHKVVCGLCHATYYRTFHYKKNDRKKEKIVLWKCSTFMDYGRKSKEYQKPGLWKYKTVDDNSGCDNLSLPEEYLNQNLEKVCEIYCTELSIDKTGILNHALEILKEVFDNTDFAFKMEKLNHKKKEIEKRQDRLLDKLLDEIITDEDFKLKKYQLEKRLEELKSEIVNLEQIQNRQKETEKRLLSIRKRIEDTGMNQALTEEMIDEIERIEVYPQHLKIKFHLFQSSEQSNIENQSLGEEDTENYLLKQNNPLNSTIEIPITDQSIRGKKAREKDEIMKLMKENSKVTAKKIAEKTGCSLSAVEYKIRSLKRENKISYYGKGGHGEWVVHL